MKTNTVKLHRVLQTSPKNVFRAFADPLAMASWNPPYGFLCQVHEMDFREGGQFKMSFVNFTTGTAQSFGGTFQEIRPEEFIRYSDKFDDPNLPGEMITTIKQRCSIWRSLFDRSESTLHGKPFNRIFSNKRLQKMKQIYLIFTLATLMVTSSCYTTRTAGNSGKVPPGQAKKRVGAKSAKPFAPGQRKK